ncbi:DNA polymerase III subunit delta [Pseudogracilibacillus sp. SE30717A]|uniref:DNA polymerase III subunit delta n=1 Tax=Pseudogracilibacillus sp. SE30717A TaxID=3098293 RepID=UPI00300DD409
MSSLNQVITDLRKGQIKPVYLLYGTEQYFIEQFKQNLTHVLSREISEDITTYDLTDISIQEIIVDAETIPFFNEKKLFFLSEPTFLKTKPDSISVNHDLKKLESYIENPAEFTVIVIVAAFEKLDERKKITKTLKQKAVTVDCNPIKDKELRKWIQFMAKQYKINMEEEALFLLETEFGNNLYLLQQEMEKLALFVGEEGMITGEIVKNVASSSLTFNALELVDAVLKKDLHTAIKIYKDLEKQKEEPIGLIALLAYQFRVIYQVKLLKQNGFANQQIQKEIKVHPYVVQLAAKRSAAFSEERLSAIINELTNTDMAIKTGKMDKNLAFEMLLYHLIKEPVSYERV